MSVYAQAAATGIQSIGLMISGDTATYNAVYAAEARKTAIAEAKHTAELNISAIEQDKITSNTAIRMRQDQAEAQAKLSAAVAGVEGGSVDAVIYDTERNEAFALNAANQQAEQAKEAQAAQVGSQQSALLSVTEPESSLSEAVTGGLMEAFSAFELSDLEIGAAMFGGDEKPEKKTYNKDFNASNLNPFAATA